MENEDYRIINKNDTTIKCFRDGRIETLCKRTNKYCKKGEWMERSNNPKKNGYIRIMIGAKHYLAHRIIMIAFVGESEQCVDHINRIKTDNRFENLHYCTHIENNLNRDFCDNAKGCYWDKKAKKWRALISIDGKCKHLGYFDNEQDAHQAFLQAKARRNLE
tara:strand:- start:688 stop:1173 length:486 start_codon:yes stop_codon:yes gene_type:complete